MNQETQSMEDRRRVKKVAVASNKIDNKRKSTDEYKFEFPHSMLHLHFVTQINNKRYGEKMEDLLFFYLFVY